MGDAEQTPATLIGVGGIPIHLREQYADVREALLKAQVTDALVEFSQALDDWPPIAVRARSVDWVRPSVLPYHLDPLGGGVQR